MSGPIGSIVTRKCAGFCLELVEMRRVASLAIRWHDKKYCRPNHRDQANSGVRMLVLKRQSRRSDRRGAGNLMSRFWFANCPLCQQGRLFVEVHLESDTLMLECEECSSAWTSPDQVSTLDNAFLAIEIPSRFATASDIEQNGWSVCQFNQGED
jgi:hypothetical protein